MKRQINSLAGLSSTKKRNKQFMKLAESFNNTKLINEALLDSETESYDIEKSANYGKAMQTLKEKSKRQEKANRKLSEDLKMDILTECVATLAYDAIMLDEDYKLENKERLIENFSNIFKGLANNGCIKGETSPLFESYIAPAVSVFPEIDSNIEEPDKIITAVKSIEDDMDASEDKTVITETIRDKVLEVIKEEKLFASKRNFLKEAYGKKFDGSSLFNSLNMHNFMQAKNDLLLNTQDLTLEKFNQSEKLMTQVNEKALAETICDYTFLETLNTCGLLKENNANVITNAKKAINLLYKSEF